MSGVLGLFVLVVCGFAENEESTATVPHVEARIDGEDLSGFVFPVSRQADSFPFVLHDGRVKILPLSKSPSEFEETRVPVSSVPSAALVECLAFKDVVTQDFCEESLFLQKPVAKVFVAALSHEEEEVRFRSLRVLKTNPRLGLSRAIRACIKDPSERVRREAVSAYCKAQPTDLYPTLLRSLGSERSMVVKHRIIDGLGKFGDACAAGALLDLLGNQENDPLRPIIFRSLYRLTRHKHGSDQVRWENWWHNHGDQQLKKCMNEH